MSDTQDTQNNPGAPSSAEVSQPLDRLIASIRAAVDADASPETRAAGATACRSILTALEAKPGQPLPAARPTATPTSPIAGLFAQFASMPRDKIFEFLKQLATSPRSPLGGILTQLAGMPREQLIELINKQLRTLAPAGTLAQPPAGPRFHMIPIPQVPRRGP